MSVTLAKAPAHIAQCEGCYGPLGSYLDAGVHIPDNRIKYYLCAEHEPYDTMGASIHLDYGDNDCFFGDY